MCRRGYGTLSRNFVSALVSIVKGNASFLKLVLIERDVGITT